LLHHDDSGDAGRNFNLMKGSSLPRLRLLFRLWWWQFGRRLGEGQGRLERRLLGAVGGLLGVGMLGMGLVLEWMLWMIPPAERLHGVHALVLSLVLFWPLMQSLWQEGPSLPLRSWLLWPVSRAWLAHALQGFSMLQVANGLLGLLLLGVWLGSVVTRFTLLPALGWLLATALLVTAAQWAANLLRLLRLAWPGGYVLVWLGGLAGLGALGRQGGLAWVAEYTLEAPLVGKPEGFGVLLGLNAVLYGAGWLLIRRTLYVDHTFMGRVPTAAAERPRWSASATWHLALLQWRLLWRHRYARLFVYLPVIYGLLGGVQLLVGLQTKNLFYVLIGVVFLFIGTVSILNSGFSFQSLFADGLFTWPIPYRALGAALLLVGAMLALPVFFVALSVWALLALLPAFCFEAMQVQQLASLFLYLVGLVHPLLLLQAPLHAVRMELHAQSMWRVRSGFSRQPLRLAGMVLLLIGPAVAALLAGPYGMLLLAVGGGAGLLLYPHWLDLLEQQLIQHKHELLAHLRAT